MKSLVVVCGPAGKCAAILAWFLAAGGVGWAEETATSSQATVEKGAKQEVAGKSPKVRLEAHCIDGSILKLTMLDRAIPLKTEYGVLEIPLSDVRRVDFATKTRVGAEDQIAAAVAKLGDPDFDVRERASAELLAIGEMALPAVQLALKSEDAEVVARAERLIEKLRQARPDQDVEVYDDDIVHTAKSQIAGQIQLDALKVESGQFGEQQLKLVTIRRLLAEGVDTGPDPSKVLPDPGNLANYQGQVGKVLYFRVTAPKRPQGNAVWGSDIYTFDSHLATAAVHAGAIQPGETKVVSVTMLGPQASFSGSQRNGVNTSPWGQYPSAYKINMPNRHGFGGVVIGR